MKKYSVGTEQEKKTIGKSRKRGVIIIAAVVIILVVLFLLGSTGCSNASTDEAPKASVFTSLNNSVHALEGRVTWLEDNLPTQYTLPTTISGLPATVTSMNTSLWAAINSINGSEAYDDSEIIAQLNYINGSVLFLTTRLNSLEEDFEDYMASGSSIPTPTPTGTATPTPTSTPSGNHAPGIDSLTAVQFGSTTQSWIVTCTATDADGDALSYDWAASAGGYILKMAEANSVIWYFDFEAFGHYSLACQVSDGNGGYDIDIVAKEYN